ncbi:MAG: hypothetical protein IJQ41_02050 [Firmicutes bacterium]|nr:hypothetical protein [Bacillota bacterium]
MADGCNVQEMTAHYIALAQSDPQQLDKNLYKRYQTPVRGQYDTYDAFNGFGNAVNLHMDAIRQADEDNEERSEERNKTADRKVRRFLLYHSASTCARSFVAPYSASYTTWYF